MIYFPGKKLKNKSLLMDAFDVYDKLKSNESQSGTPTTSTCLHTSVINSQGTSLCDQCGVEIYNPDETQSEWKYYGMCDNVYNSHKDNCFIRKHKDKTIYPDLATIDVSDHIKDIANDIYVEVCRGKVHRGTRRRSIVFASVFHAYKLNNTPQSCETLIKIFKIKRKDALKGLKFINDNISKDSPIRDMYITPEHLIREFLSNFQVSTPKKSEIIQLYHYVKNKSSVLNRSRPQSVASGVIWYWIRANNKQLSIKDFSKKVELSELTINKMAKEVARITGTDIQV